MNRVVAQGDMRPFAGRMQGQGRPAALEEIRQLLADRDRLYSRADATLDTTGRPLKESFSELKKALTERR